jgi:hypothetical protein
MQLFSNLLPFRIISGSDNQNSQPDYFGTLNQMLNNKSRDVLDTSGALPTRWAVIEAAGG